MTDDPIHGVITAITSEQAGGVNVAAFLRMLASSELGEGQINAETDWGYRILVGSTPGKLKLFNSYREHPNIYDRRTNSTAAGRYQILNRFWRAYAPKFALNDFSPANQDRYAIIQLRERGALPLIKDGRFDEAIAKVNNIWASLPGSPYGQHTNELSVLRRTYLRAGGRLTQNGGTNVDHGAKNDVG